MKIENKNKKKMYSKFLVRSGISIGRHMQSNLSSSAIWQMKHKPYDKENNKDVEKR